MKKNTLIVAEGSDNAALYRKEITLTDVNFITPSYSHILKNMRIRKNGLRVMARVRYRQPLSSATLTCADSTLTDAYKLLRKSASSPRRSAMLVFEHAQKFVAPGQSAVFYVKDLSASPPRKNSGQAGRSSSELRMLGGGVIV